MLPAIPASKGFSQSQFSYLAKMSKPAALLIGDITHVKNDWESLAPAIELLVSMEIAGVLLAPFADEISNTQTAAIAKSSSIIVKVGNMMRSKRYTEAMLPLQ